MSQTPLKNTIWYHYKHNPKHGLNHMAYQVIGTAFDTLSEKLVVVYKPLYKISEARLHNIDFFTRPAIEWYETVEFKGKTLPRFREVSAVERGSILDLFN